MIEIGDIDANMQENSITPSPKYIGCLTTAYANLVRIFDDIGITAKLLPMENIEAATIRRPIIKKKEEMLRRELFISITLTATILETIIPSQYGLYKGAASDKDLLLNNNRIPIEKLQNRAPSLTKVRKVHAIVNVLNPTMARFKNVIPKVRFIK